MMRYEDKRILEIRKGLYFKNMRKWILILSNLSSTDNVREKGFVPHFKNLN